jgi:peroxiredoxin
MRAALALACAFVVFLNNASAQQRTLAHLPTLLSAGGDTVDLLAVSDSEPLLVVRHLGATCSHCVEQLRAIIRHHTVLGPLPCRVIALSADDVQTCDSMTKHLRTDPNVISLCSDHEDAVANALGCVIAERDGTITDLHLVMVLYRRRVLFEHYSITPLMSFGDVMSVVANLKR